MNPSTGNGFDNVGFGISSGQGVGGDTALINSAFVGQKKNKKPIIVGLIVLLLIVLIVLLIWLFGFGGSKKENGGELKRSFNEYVNYVFLGEKSDSEFDEAIINERPYFEGLNNDQKRQYLIIANEKYELLKKEYYEIGGYEDLNLMKNYFQDFPEIQLLEADLNNKVLSAYLNSGSEEAKKVSSEMLEVDIRDYYLAKYVIVVEKINELRLYIIGENNGSDCLMSGNLGEECQNVSQVDIEKYRELLFEKEEYEFNIREMAVKVLENIYESIYNSNVDKENEDAKN